MPGFLDFLTAAATGASTGLQANDQLEQRKRQQTIEDDRIEEEKRLRGLEKALLSLELDREMNPQERFNVEGGAVVPQGGYRTREEAEEAAKGQRSMMRRDDLGERNREVMQTERVAEARARGTAAGTPPKPPDPDAGGPVGESGRMAAALYPIAKDAFERMNAMATPTFRQTLAGASGGMFGNYFNTPEGRQFQQVSNQFLSSALAILSGKTVSEDEVRRVSTVYIPQPGDDPATVDAKMRTMGLMAQSIRQMAGQPEEGGAPSVVIGPPGGSAVAPSDAMPSQQTSPWQARADELKAMGLSESEIVRQLRREGLIG